ncbi:hypothetical protein [Notoacmeibacter sp. MSK16QG-6]|uniref:antitoxin VbhA family protein n=1 Tax=Notoacmeibacter sp. MSK16QG-6 TaxID=2957982 RepID=UPI0020A020B2|nr:hypothetical protein [Notoacmeibacter sp. MSK16QG-6]MCP1201065.1 hypothetical protein [Notoacmeibacter sp. MSK16QG-6]
MNVQQKRPDRSPEAIERRRRAAERAHAANYREGLMPSPVFAEATERFIAGEITMEELRAIGLSPAN